MEQLITIVLRSGSERQKERAESAIFGKANFLMNLAVLTKPSQEPSTQLTHHCLNTQQKMAMWLSRFRAQYQDFNDSN